MIAKHHILIIFCAALALTLVGSHLTTAQMEFHNPQHQLSKNENSGTSRPALTLESLIQDSLNYVNQIPTTTVNYNPNENSFLDNFSSQSENHQSIDEENPKLDLETILNRSREIEIQKPATLVNYAPSNDISDTDILRSSTNTLNLVAKLSPNGEILTQGIIWRIFSTFPNTSGNLELVAESNLGNPTLQLKPGKYIVNASFGLATTTKEVTVPLRNQHETLILNAGGMKLSALVDQSVLLPNEKVKFDIYSMDYNSQGERVVIAKGIKQGQIVRLNADTYHIVSYYGKANAVVSADVQIQPGKLIEVQMLHSAAEITLKLVNEALGEALIGTTWSVFTKNGEIVAEGNGAFPSHVLATGEYEVVSEHRGKNFKKIFKVEAGIDRVIEVMRVN